MPKSLRMRAVRRKQIDDEKLALAFLLLAKVLNDHEQAAAQPDESRTPGDEETA